MGCASIGLGCKCRSKSGQCMAGAAQALPSSRTHPSPDRNPPWCSCAAWLCRRPAHRCAHVWMCTCACVLCGLLTSTGVPQNRRGPPGAQESQMRDFSIKCMRSSRSSSSEYENGTNNSRHCTNMNTHTTPGQGHRIIFISRIARGWTASICCFMTLPS